MGAGLCARADTSVLYGLSADRVSLVHHNRHASFLAGTVLF